MAALPWMKFEVSKWRSDGSVARLSSGARGVWAEIIFWFQEDNFYMVDDPIVMMAKQLRFSTREVLAGLIEIGRAGVAEVVLYDPADPGGEKIVTLLSHPLSRASHGEVTLNVTPSVTLCAKVLLRRAFKIRSQREKWRARTHKSRYGAFPDDVDNLLLLPLSEAISALSRPGSCHVSRQSLSDPSSTSIYIHTSKTIEEAKKSRTVGNEKEEELELELDLGQSQKNGRAEPSKNGHSPAGKKPPSKARKPAAGPASRKPTEAECQAYFAEHGADVYRDAALMGSEFFTYWESVGWTRGSGRKISKWRSAAANKITKDRIGGRTGPSQNRPSPMDGRRAVEQKIKQDDDDEQQAGKYGW